MQGHKSVKKNDRIFLDFNAGLGRNVFYNYDDNGGDASDILRSQVAGNLRLIFIGKLSFGFRIG